MRFGRGVLTDAMSEIAGFGDRLLVVHGRSADRAAPLIEGLKALGAEVSTAPASHTAGRGEPTTSTSASEHSSSGTDASASSASGRNTR